MLGSLGSTSDRNMSSHPTALPLLVQRVGLHCRCRSKSFRQHQMSVLAAFHRVCALARK